MDSADDQGLSGKVGNGDRRGVRFRKFAFVDVCEDLFCEDGGSLDGEFGDEALVKKRGGHREVCR